MAGRKRKDAPRTPSGQISRANEETRYAPAAIKRLTDYAIAASSDPRLGSEVGRLLLNGSLTAKQAGAAWKLLEIVTAYRTAIEAPRCKPNSLERGQKSEAPEEGTDAAEAINKRLVRDTRRYERAQMILISHSQQARQAVERIAVYDVALISYEALVAARGALDALAVHFAQG